MALQPALRVELVDLLGMLVLLFRAVKVQDAAVFEVAVDVVLLGVRKQQLKVGRPDVPSAGAMGTRRLVPNVITYNSAISACEKGAARGRCFC